MAKFCTKCGKKLEEGQVCDCQGVVSNQQPVVSNNTNGVDINEIINSYIEIVKGLFVKPIDTIKNFATSNNFVLGLVAIVLNCIVSGIFVYCLASEFVGLFSSLLGFGSSYNSLLGLAGASIEVPFMQTFLTGFAFMAVELAVLALMIYVMAGVVFKAKVDVKKMFSLVGVCSVFTTITTIVAIVLNYVSMTAMFVVLLVAGMFYLTYLYQGISETTDVEKNKLAYVFVPAVSVATFVVVYILPKVFF